MNTNEVLKLALEALEWCHGGEPCGTAEAITALREALAEQPAPPPECQTEAEKTAYAFGWFKALESVRKQPAQQEPVAAQSVMTVRIWRDKNSDQNAEFKNWHKLPDGEHILYTSPPAQQEPVANYCRECLTYNGHHEGCSHYTSQPAQRKPLTLGQKQRLWSGVGDKPTLKDRVNAYGLAIEAAHGIKGDA